MTLFNFLMRNFLVREIVSACGAASIELPMHDKKLKHFDVNANYKNISYYILFVFIKPVLLKKCAAL